MPHLPPYRRAALLATPAALALALAAPLHLGSGPAPSTDARTGVPVDAAGAPVPAQAGRTATPAPGSPAPAPTARAPRRTATPLAPFPSGAPTATPDDDAPPAPSDAEASVPVAVPVARTRPRADGAQARPRPTPRGAARRPTAAHPSTARPPVPRPAAPRSGDPSTRPAPPAAVPPSPAVPPPPAGTPRPEPAQAGLHIVTLAAPAAATAPAMPRKGGRLDARSATVTRYEQAQKSAQRSLARRHGVTVLRQFSTVLNGFVAPLTAEQVTALRKDPAVASVTRRQVRHPTVYRTPTTLGLTGSAGVWSKVSPTRTAPYLDAGKGVVVGVLDTGIWPENASFRGAPLLGSPTTAVGSAWSADGGAGTTMVKADGRTFHGSCTGATALGPAAQWTTSLCNQKLVSARAFPPAGTPTSVVADDGTHDYASPRDNDGHGTHTGSTAAGLEVDMGSTYGRSAGIAPGAALAAYKVCWSDPDKDANGNGRPDTAPVACPDESTVAAVDQAVADGVDVLSFSVSGSTDGVTDPVEEAFRNADAAGVSVVAAAGNDGPGAGTVNHVSPWVTTVAASTYTSPQDVAYFSGRGPTTAADGGLLKPDLAAPGVGVVAATVPTTWSTSAPSTYTSMAGTSMATPHVSGLTALLRARHAGDPLWTTSATKGALMTTATDTGVVINGVRRAATPFEQGAGYVSPAASLDPGLLLDTPASAMAGFAADQGAPTDATPVGSEGLNLPSVAIPHQGGAVRVTRTFTATRAGSWTVGGSVPGFTVAGPGTVTATGRGQRLTVTWTLTPAGAPVGGWTAGRLTLAPTTSGSPTLRLPVVTRPGFDQPAYVQGTGTSGRTPLVIASPTAGRSTPSLGLGEQVSRTGTAARGATAVSGNLTVRAGAVLLDATLLGRDGDDLDLYLERRNAAGAWETADLSVGETARERVRLEAPAAGTYRVIVHGYSVPQGGGYTLRTTVVDRHDGSRVTTNPRTTLMAAGQTSTPWVVWQGLPAGRTYLATVRYPSAPHATEVWVRS